MPDRCTCGAYPPSDARFCHKCGRPLFEEVIEAEEEPEIPVAPAAPPPKPPAEINFHNSAAVRIGFLAAAAASLLISLPMPISLGLIWLLLWLIGAGVLAVFLYHRRTGVVLSVRSGARIGWITGVFCFAIATVFSTISVVSIASKGGLLEFYRQQLNGRATGEMDVEQILQVLQTPGGLAVVIVSSLLLLFLFFTLLPTVGGALGAKVFEKN